MNLSGGRYKKNARVMGGVGELLRKLLHGRWEVWVVVKGERGVGMGGDWGWWDRRGVKDE